MTKQRRDLTFKENRRHGRHGWLRLTPAYSIRVVHQLLERVRPDAMVLDPFSGTGTTGLVCAEQGLTCDLIDINPFLVWFARAKTATYTPDISAHARRIAQRIAAEHVPSATAWTPPISNIERWWSAETLAGLAALNAAIQAQCTAPSPIKDLLLVAFCRLVIETSAAAFNHQSLSFKDDRQLSLFAEDDLGERFIEEVEDVLATAHQNLTGQVRVVQGDARQIEPNQFYDVVITSPPYPNRMSYIRELRPYMYWLGYLETGREAGELDWQAIGGTWGIATSRLQQWKPASQPIPYAGFEAIIGAIGEQSAVLGNYVQRYFEDIAAHIASLTRALRPEAQVFYVVGNSKFYETLVPTEAIYAALLEANGFSKVQVEVLRKRNSKKELYEYVVTASYT